MAKKRTEQEKEALIDLERSFPKLVPGAGERTVQEKEVLTLIEEAKLAFCLYHKLEPGPSPPSLLEMVQSVCGNDPHPEETTTYVSTLEKVVNLWLYENCCLLMHHPVNQKNWSRHVTSGKTLNYRRPDNRRDQKEQPKEANVLNNDRDSENTMMNEMD